MIAESVTALFKKSSALLFHMLILGCFTLWSCGTEGKEDSEPEEEPQEEAILEIHPIDTESRAGKSPIRDISSVELVDEMGVGWNLGNTFDVTARDKTLWGNPAPTRATIDAVRAMGFGTLRIPITWGYHQSQIPPYAIEPAYIQQIKRVVDDGLQNGMHVIINVHHDNEWVVPRSSHAAETIARLTSLWTQVAEHFKVYNDSLIFEVLNEPRLEGIPEEWTGGTPEGRSYLNDFNKAAVDAIRATGGNNSLRHIMIPTWAASSIPAAMNDLVIPNDDSRIIISMHSYFPWPFAGEAKIAWGSDQDKADLRAELDKIRQHWLIDQQRPVILGEWGTIEDNPLQTRIAYAEFYVKEAKERGLLTVVWDDGGWFRLLNRDNLSWDFPDIAATIVAASQ